MLVAAFAVLTALLLLAAWDVRSRYIEFSIDRYRARMANRAEVGAADVTQTFAEVQRHLSLLANTPVTRHADSPAARELIRHIVQLLASRGVVAALIDVDGRATTTPVGALPAAALKAVVAAQQLCDFGAGRICITRTGSPQRTLVVMSTRHTVRSIDPAPLFSLVCDLDAISGRTAMGIVDDPAMSVLLVDELRRVITWSDRQRPRPVIADGHVDEGWEIPHVRIDGIESLIAQANARLGDTVVAVTVTAPIEAGIAPIGPGSTRALGIFAALLLVVAFIVLQLRRAGTAQLRALAHAHAEARRLNDGLESKVAQRTAALEAMHANMHDARQEIAAQDRMAAVGELAAVFAHEVRTPLNAMSIANQRMTRALRREGRIDPDVAAEILRDQAENVGVISEYVNRYLGLARRHDEDADAFELQGLFDEVFRLVGESARASSVGLSVTLSPDLRTVRLARSTLRHILLNLVSNAIAAQPEGGQVAVSARRRDGHLLILVRDRGPGVPTERVDTMFRPFTSWRAGGTGLGLSISRRFAADIGGTLDYEEREGGGSVFALEIPLEIPATAPDTEAGTTSAGRAAHSAGGSV